MLEVTVDCSVCTFIFLYFMSISFGDIFSEGHTNAVYMVFRLCPCIFTVIYICISFSLMCRYLVKPPSPILCSAEEYNCLQRMHNVTNSLNYNLNPFFVPCVLWDELRVSPVKLH